MVSGVRYLASHARHTLVCVLLSAHTMVISLDRFVRCIVQMSPVWISDAKLDFTAYHSATVTVTVCCVVIVSISL